VAVAIDQTVKVFGRIGVVVNNAGYGDEFLTSIFEQMNNGDTELVYGLSARQLRTNNTAI